MTKSHAIASCISQLMACSQEPTTRRPAPPRSTKGITAPLYLKMPHATIVAIVKAYMQGKSMTAIATEQGVEYNRVTKIVYNWRQGKLDGKVVIE